MRFLFVASALFCKKWCTVNFYKLDCHFSLPQILLKNIRVCALCVGADGTPVNMIICKSQFISINIKFMANCLGNWVC